MCFVYSILYEKTCEDLDVKIIPSPQWLRLLFYLRLLIHCFCSSRCFAEDVVFVPCFVVQYLVSLRWRELIAKCIYCLLMA